MRKFLIFLLVVSLSLTVLAISIEKNAYDMDYYLKSYEKNKISQLTGKSKGQLAEISENLVSYIKGQGGEELLEPYFNEKEILHMVDVQNLFNLARRIKYIGLVLSIGIVINFLKDRKYKLLGKALLFGPFVNYFIFLILGILAYIDFNKYFTYFHLIFFTNDLWILDPNKDLMIQMLPENFFMGMAKNILLSFLLYLAIIQVIGCIILRRGRIINEKVVGKD
ncbi:MAG TPA: TIGR01906 family membrane protein [Tissierellaceae bacterium]|nr:TIGR01906 family membrane protein [Tissierellaceae bacterium]